MYLPNSKVHSVNVMIAHIMLGERKDSFVCFFLCSQIVKEYERAIIFRLGRILRGGAKGPGQKLFFFIILIQPQVFFFHSIHNKLQI